MIFNAKSGELTPVSTGDISRLCDRFFPKRNAAGEPNYFPGQKEAIIKTCELLQTKRAVVIDAPVGSGKSAINYTVARIVGTTAYITSQKSLQTQIDSERFNNSNALKGRGEYNCHPTSHRVGRLVSADSWEFHNGKNCRNQDDCDPSPGSLRTAGIIDDIVECSHNELEDKRSYLSGFKDAMTKAEVESVIRRYHEKHKNAGGNDEYDAFVVKNFGCVLHGFSCCCPYKVAKSMLMMADMRIMNPDNFYYQQLATPGFADDIDLLVFDEAHCLDDAINRVMSQVVPITVMKTVLGLDWSCLVTESPLRFRQAWRECYSDLKALNASARVVDLCRPVSVSIFNGGPISASDTLKQKACELFYQAMKSARCEHVIDAVGSGAYMTSPAFLEWRRYCSTSFSSITTSADGELISSPPYWLVDFKPDPIKKAFKHFEATMREEVIDDLVLQVMDKLAEDYQSYFQIIDKLVETKRWGDKDLPVFIPVKKTGESDYGRQLKLSDGYQSQAEVSVELVCVDVGAVLNRFFYANKKLVFSSGSWIMPVKDMRILGLNPNEIEVVRVPSTFPAKARPIYHVAPLSFSEKTDDGEYLYKTDYGLKKWIKALDDVVESIWRFRAGVNIVIHSNSFALSKLIAENAAIDENWLFHFSDQRTSVYNHAVGIPATVVRKEDGVHRLKTEPKSGLVLISPSVKEGVDFKYEAARAQIVVKAPVPYMGDPYIKAMAYGVKELEIEGDRDFITRRCIRDFMQMYGRVMRSPDDGGFTFVLDQKMIGAIAECIRHKGMNTEYIRTGLAAVDTMVSGVKTLKWTYWPYFKT